jgi:hypothetical protein
MQETPVSSRIPLPRWFTLLLAMTAVGLVPWTLYLTFTLPSHQVTDHYDVAWVVFDIALLSVIATTTYFAVRGSEWLVPFAAVTGTMLVCDAWFDVVTSIGGSDWVEAVLEAILAELPLAAVCALIVHDAERFRQETVGRLAHRRRPPT